MKNIVPAVICVFLSLTFISCEKDPAPTPPVETELSGRGVLVLNEGIFNMNNTTLTWYDFETENAITDWFEVKNNRKLGDTGNDLKIYGNKIYIVMNGSSQVEVLDINSGLSIKQIPFFDDNKPRQPRNVDFHNGKAFVCSFDGTVAVIDTVSLDIEKFIPVGRNPDGIAVAAGKIYVSNSGGLDFPNFDNTVSVIDPQNLAEVKKITVGANPYTLQGDGKDFIYLISRGNYGDIPMSFQIIDTRTDELVYTFTGLSAMNFTLEKDVAYVYDYDFMSGTSHISSVDLINRTVTENFITDQTVIQTVYAIYADEVSGDVFIADAKDYTSNGVVYCFDKDGKKKYSFTTGANPGSISAVYTRK